MVLPIYLSYERPHSAPENVNKLFSDYKIYKIKQESSSNLWKRNMIVEQGLKSESQKVLPKSVEPTLKESEVAQSLIPTFSFYQQGEDWLIGEPGKEAHLDGTRYKGLAFIHYLLHHSGKEVPVEVVYHLGKSPQIEGVGQVKHFNFYEDSFAPEWTKKIIDSRTESQVKELLIELKQQHDDLNIKNQSLELIEQVEANYDEEINKLDKKIEFLEKYLNEGRLGGKKLKFRTPESESARTNVQKLAIKEIHEKVPALKPYLNLERPETIHTGHNCSYRPGPGIRPEWILYPPQTPQKKF